MDCWPRPYFFGIYLSLPFCFFAAFLYFFHSLGPLSYGVAYTNTGSGNRKEGFKASERYPSIPRAIPRAIPQNGENSPLHVLGKPSSFLRFSSSIDLLFIPFSVPTGRACKISSGRNCIEKSFLVRFEPVSSQSPGVEGYGETTKQHGAKNPSHSSLERSSLG